MRFSGAQDAVARLFALAQALTNDYEQFEALVDGATPNERGPGPRSPGESPGPAGAVVRPR